MQYERATQSTGPFPRNVGFGKGSTGRVHDWRRRKGIQFGALVQLSLETKRLQLNMPEVTRAAPYAEPLWSSRGYSAYYNDSHYRLRRELRNYVEQEISPYAAEWEHEGKVPVEV